MFYPTPGNSVTFLLYCLATNPDKQEILYKEICEQVPEGEKVPLFSILASVA